MTNIEAFKPTDLVTPISPKNHAYGEILLVSEIWSIGKGGKDGRVIAGGFSFLPTQLEKVNNIP
jgi:hypothetical protein